MKKDILQRTEDVILLPNHPPQTGVWPLALTQSQWCMFRRSTGCLIQPMISRPGRNRSRNVLKERNKAHGWWPWKSLGTGETWKFQRHSKSRAHWGLDPREEVCLLLSEVLSNSWYESIVNEISLRIWITCSVCSMHCSVCIIPALRCENINSIHFVFLM